MGLDSLPDHVKTQQQAVDFFAKMDGVTDHEFIEHEPVQVSWMRWTKTLWTINKGTILCHLLYEKKDLHEPGDENLDEDPFNWYYQVYAEHAGPCMLNVPLRMLEATTCPGDKWAKDWRKDVLKYHGVKKKDWPKYMKCEREQP
jgi:hypothetical protein